MRRPLSTLIALGLLSGCGSKTVRTHLVSKPTPKGFIARSPAMSEDGRWVIYDQEGRESDVGIRHQNQGVWHANRDGFQWTVGIPDGHRALNPDISADGQWIAFVTTAPLLARDRNHLEDVYVWRARDRNHNGLELVSTTPQGEAGNGRVLGHPKISPDGRFVVWISHATDYVGAGADPDGPVASVFMRDRQSKKTWRLAVSADFEGAATHIDGVDFARLEDGTVYLAVETAAGLINDDSNGKRDVYGIAIQPAYFKLPQNKHSYKQYSPMAAGAEAMWSVELVSVGAQGVLGDAESYGAHVLLPARARAAAEFGGRPLVVFTSEARTLSQRDGDLEPDVFIQAFDPAFTGITPMPPRQLTHSIKPSEKGKCTAGDAENLRDGDIMVAMSCRGPLVAEDSNHVLDVYVATLASGPVLASRPDPDMEPKEWTKGPPSKQLGNAPSMDPDLSMDGCHVAFASESRNLTNEYDDDPHTEIFSRYNPMGWPSSTIRKMCGWAPRDNDL